MEEFLIGKEHRGPVIGGLHLEGCEGTNKSPRDSVPEAKIAHIKNIRDKVATVDDTNHSGAVRERRKALHSL